MAPKLPRQRADPSPSPSTSYSHPAPSSSTLNDTPIVVSASSRSAFSPSAAAIAGGLAPDASASPQLRIRNSPRTGNLAGTGRGAFGSQRESYPSPSAAGGSAKTPARNGEPSSHGHPAPASGSASGSGSGGSGNRVRTIFGRRRKNSDTIALDSAPFPSSRPDAKAAAAGKGGYGGLDVQVSPAGTPGSGKANGFGGWRQLPEDFPSSSPVKQGLASDTSNGLYGGAGAGGSGGVAVKRFDARGYPTRPDLKADANGGVGSASGAGSPSKMALLRGSEQGPAPNRAERHIGTKMGSGEGESAAARYAYTSRQSYLGGVGAAAAASGSSLGSSGQVGHSSAYTHNAASQLHDSAHSRSKSQSQSQSLSRSGSQSKSLYPPTLTNYSLSSPSYSPSDVVASASSSADAPGTGSSSTSRANTGRGGRADYFAATASVLDAYENVRTPSDDEGLSGYPSSRTTGSGSAPGANGAQVNGAAAGSGSRGGNRSRNGSIYSGYSGTGTGSLMGMGMGTGFEYDKYEPTHYDGYNYARSITGTLRTHRTAQSEVTVGSMGSRAHLGRYDALQDQFQKDRGLKVGATGGVRGGEGEGHEGCEGYEYGVGGLRDDYGAFSVGSRGGKKHLGQIFSLPPDPTSWSYLGPEADDELHDPDAKPRGRTGFMGSMFTLRGAGNVGCLALLMVVLVGMFAVYPITSQFLNKVQSTYGAYNLGGINATGQIPSFGTFQLIDADTPSSAYTHTSLETGQKWDLVFSDEFNRDGRTFWPGDDPFWEAQDLHYWQTNNKEWYHPTMVTTTGGSLRITLTNEKMNGLNYTGGMINSWNRFCFTGGYVEASVSLPGKNNVYGLWPAIWTLGNLGRAGYGGTLDGVWPYSYDSCDVGTLHNQTLNGLPAPARGSGDKNNLDHLSYLPGQRLSRCTCPDDPTHPGPKHPDGTWVGRAAPEIDMFEAVIDSDTYLGEVSQSAQWAPFDPYYQFDNASANFEIYNESMTYINPWLGSVWQQATTALSYTDPNCYTGETGCYSKYGFEYAPGTTDGYITWVSDDRLAWTVRAGAMGPNAVSKVSQRPVPQEPMYLLLNLGLSENFGPVDYEGLEKLFPVHMDVDYIRVYQDPNQHNIGCDPEAFPTQAYINRFMDVYTNPNITVMGQIENFTMPRNSLIDTC